MSRPLICALVIAALGLQATPIQAQESAPEPPAVKAKSLDELLELVRQGRLAEDRENRRREQEFLAAKQDQQRLLKEAKATLAAEERRSERLEKSFNENEQKLAQLEAQLRDRMGALGELFGIVRVVAGDTRGVVEDSLVSAQLPGRGEFLAELAQSKTLPSIPKLERLWFLLQQEATEAGKVVRFPATVITLAGEPVEKEVVRVGVFNAVAEGEYLQFLADTGRLSELGRQPASQHVSTLDDLESPDSPFVGVSLDPSRGTILGLLVQTPTFRERIDQGKTIGRIIIVLAVIGFALAFTQWIALLLVNRKIAAQLRGGGSSGDNPLGRVLRVYDENRGADVETLELKLDEAILRETPRLERFLTTIRVLSVVAPLLGLLGTVTGMIQTFQSITLFGTGDPKLMAGGISEALVTTMLGLYTAIPLVLLHSFVSGRSKAITHVLEEQSAGLIARRAEEEQHASG